MIEIVGPTLFAHNYYYENIIKLHLSTFVCKGDIKLVNNSARYILRAKAMSYFMISENTTVNISSNTVYKVAIQDCNFGIDSLPVCPIQFNSKSSKLDKEGNLTFSIIANQNIHTTSLDLPGEDKALGYCTWLAGSAFNTRTAKEVYKSTLCKEHCSRSECQKNYSIECLPMF